MADFVFNAVKGKAAEKVADATTSLGILLLKTAESDALMMDRATVTAVLSGSAEADFTNYARKTSLTGTVTVDNANDQVTVSVPDQTWTAAGGTTNNTLAKLVVFLDEGGTDATRIPLVGLDCVITTAGNNLIVTFNASGFFRAA